MPVDALDLTDLGLEELGLRFSFDDELFDLRMSFRYRSISSGCCVVK